MLLIQEYLENMLSLLYWKDLMILRKKNKLSELDMFLEDCYNKYHMRENSKYSDKKSSDTKINKDEFKTDLKKYYGEYYYINR